MKFFKNPINILIIAVVLGLAIGSYAYFGVSKSHLTLTGLTGSKQTSNDTTIKRMDLTEEVDVSGEIKPSQNIDLAFERGGKVSAVHVAVGDKVKAGQTLVTVENSEYSALLLQAQANVNAQEAKLTELKNGTRPEEMQVQQTYVANANQAVSEAEKNLETTQDKATASLADAYNNSISVDQDAVEAGKSALYTLTDIQYAHQWQANQVGINITNSKAAAVQELLGTSNAGDWIKDYLSPLNGGAYGQVQSAVANPTNENIDAASQSALSALRKVKLALDSITISDDLSAAEKTNLDLVKNNINAKITSVTTKQNAIEVQKMTNASSITAAQTGLTNAKSALANAQNGLNIGKAGASSEEIQAQEAQVQAAQASVKDAQSQISKTIINAPIDGTISKVDAKLGEIAPPDTPIISMMSAGKFQIETHVSENDIVKIKLGETANVTIDAYGNDTIFAATVTNIDPAETIVNGGLTYKVTLQFTLDDDRIKSGMTANVKILTEDKKNVMAVPEGTIITKGADKFVLLDTGNASSEERKVIVGIQGTNGYVEIVSGLNDGDKLLNFGNNQ